jgi:beta-lactamase superfamily II metal-dependent hydrolase
VVPSVWALALGAPLLAPAPAGAMEQKKRGKEDEDKKEAPNLKKARSAFNSEEFQGKVHNKSEIVQAVPYDAGPRLLHLFMVDVGQGDSVVAVCPGADHQPHVLLVDAGSTNKANAGSNLFEVLQRINAVQMEGKDEEALKAHHLKIDALVLTHPHKDHFSLVDAVFNEVRPEVGHIFFGGKRAEYKQGANNWLVGETYDYLAKKPIVYGDPGDHPVQPVAAAAKPEPSFTVGNCNAFVIAANSGKPNQTNDLSVVIKLQYGPAPHQAVMLTGDGEEIMEEAALHRFHEHPEFLQADVLKVGHHGSTTSSDPEWLHAVKPKVALISSGVFKDQLPRCATIEALRAMGLEAGAAEHQFACFNVHADLDVVFPAGQLTSRLRGGKLDVEAVEEAEGGEALPKTHETALKDHKELAARLKELHSLPDSTEGAGQLIVRQRSTAPVFGTLQGGATSHSLHLQVAADGSITVNGFE